MSNPIVSPYLQAALHPKSFKSIINTLAEELKPFKDKFDTIVFTGSSGCMVGPALASKMNKQMLLVRKENDNSHSSYLCEGYYELSNYIIIDDLISTCRTIRRIVGRIIDDCDVKKQRQNPLPINCIGIMTYFDPDDGQPYLPGGIRYEKVKEILGHENFFLKGIFYKIRLD